MWEVILFDCDFEIERPIRFYKQTLNAIKGPFKDDNSDSQSENDDLEPHPGRGGAGDPNDPSTTDIAQNHPEDLRDASNHTFYIKSTERRLKLVAKNARQMDQFSKFTLFKLLKYFCKATRNSCQY